MSTRDKVRRTSWMAEFNTRQEAVDDARLEEIHVPAASPERTALIEDILAAYPRLDEALPDRFAGLVRYITAKRYLLSLKAAEQRNAKPDRNHPWHDPRGWLTDAEKIVDEGIERYGWDADTTIEDGRAAARLWLESLNADDLVKAYARMCCEDYR